MAPETAVTHRTVTPVTAATGPSKTTVTNQPAVTPTVTAGVTARSRAVTLLHNPGLYLGTTLGATAALAPTGPLLVGTTAATAAAAGWATLALHPGPWRWLPGHGEPWEWMCRSSRRGYRRSLRRMRRRLNASPEQQLTVVDGLLQPIHSPVGTAWYDHSHRPALLRAATAHQRKVRCEALRTLWTKALPDWENGWWRRYTPTEMALRAGPLAAVPASGLAPLPWWAHAAVISAAASWGAWVWQRPEAAPQTDPTTGRGDWYLARWAEWIACDRGPLPGSRLAAVELDEDRLTAVIVSTTTKKATTVGQDEISIAFDIPPQAVNLYRPDAWPANRAKLTVRLRARPASELDEDDLPAVWTEYSPYAGSVLSGVEATEHGRRFVLQMPRRGSSVADVQPRSIAQALDLPGEDATARLHLRVLDARRIEVNEMTRNPLQDGVPLDLDALLMDADGYVTVGRDIYGRPARWRLMIPNTGKYGLTGQQGMSAVHSFASGTTGSGKSSLEETLLVAQRLNGFVGWLADGKYGAGFAAWTKECDWLVKSHYGAMLMAQAATAVGKHRFSRQMKSQWKDDEGYVMDGRSFFVPGEPFAPMQVTFDEFNEMVMDSTKPHVKPLTEGVSNLGRQTRSAGIGARVYVQIPNLDSIGSDKNAGAIRDMLQSGNIALFRTARSDVNTMSLGSRTPEFRLGAIPEAFPDGSGTAGLGYIADGSAQYTQSRMMFHSNTVRVARDLPLPTLTDEEAEAAGPAYLHRDAYRHMDAAEEEDFLRDLLRKEQHTPTRTRTVIDLASTTPTSAAADDETDDEDLDQLVPPSRSELVWHAVDTGARRNKDIAQTTSLKPTNVAGATRRLERLGKLHKINREWHTREPINA